jgi:hypothetical protein
MCKAWANITERKLCTFEGHIGPLDPIQLFSATCNSALFALWCSPTAVHLGNGAWLAFALSIICSIDVVSLTETACHIASTAARSIPFYVIAD